MSLAFSRRLVLFSTLALAGVLATLIAATALFAFSFYIAALKVQIQNEVGDVRAYVAAHGTPAGAVALGEAISQRFFRSDVVVTVLDPAKRVVVRARAPQPSGVRLSNVAVDVSARSRVTPSLTGSGPATRISMALATLFGLSAVRAEFGDVTVVVRASELGIADTVARFAPGFAFAEILACIAGFLLARLLTQEALRPLVAVNAALERFASGDLTPQLVSADGGSDLGALARAYNGAVAQMASALAERERAEAVMHQFISDAGHQLKTPLTVIRGFISVLRRTDVRSGRDVERILEKMNRQSVVMAELIEKLLLLERWERGEDAPHSGVIDVAQLVEDVVTPIAEAQPARHMALEIVAGACAAIDPSDFAHAVTNLVDNALKYTHGDIRVRVAGDHERVVVEVSDEGPGMTTDELNHAFDRFYRGATRREIDGSGLGLSIAKRAVERAGGSIEAHSDPHGSRFTIVLPAYGVAA